MKGQRKPTVAERLVAGELSEIEAVELTREAALTSLDRAMQCRYSVATKLVERGYPAAAVAQVLDRLEAVGVLDDVAYAQAVVRARLERGLAPRAIQAELSRKGVAMAATNVALADIDSAGQAAAARRVIEKVLRTSSGLTQEVKAKRAYAALSRRGYPAEVAAAAIATTIGAEVISYQ